MIPYDQIDTLFLDVGNTLISIDFDRVAGELGQRGVRSSAEAISRAEAAAGVHLSNILSKEPITEGLDSFETLLLGIFSQLEEVPGGAACGRNESGLADSGSFRSTLVHSDVGRS